MKNIPSLSTVLASAFLASASLSVPAQSADFAIQPLAQGYQLAENAAAKPAEGKCGAATEGKSHEGKCGAEHKDDGEKKPEGKAKEGKCGEGKCGANKKG
ncbi:MAG TPA: hypothetical protein PKD17_13435 [Cellvibrionaceae bacterium]|nr:hypothetical protein [Cellvibrionaceae bacterium]HMY39101.1 hypothetical protein [Marinagarivorans sp.]HNG58516.1 hypothetical protein [Cellvibrionaceae bacterium]